jgi:LuxR family transcriptional regulator, maltose regulon positive regulatory protein
MSMPLIATKFFIPAANQEFIHRDRLLKQLNDYHSKKITLVCAPAGFGKTTLVSDWIQTHNIYSSWISIDESDNDLIRFYTYIIQSLQKIDKAIGKELVTKFEVNEPLNSDTIITYLINDITESREHFILVLDDYHLINTATIHQSLVFFLDNLPENIHLIITTRTTPPLQIAKLRARNQIIEIQSKDLRFNLDEVSQFLKQVRNIKMSDADIRELNQRTEGWIVGLQLAALSFDNQTTSSNIISDFTGDHRFVTDYLVDEVLSRQPEEIQLFLLKTTILDRMCADLCDTVLEISNGQTILEILEKSNLFLVQLDSKREWYRYHHLFSEMLLTRLGQRFKTEISSLYFKAYEWHLNQHLDEEAIRYALRGEFYKEAADLIEQKGFFLYWTNNVKLLIPWLRDLPSDLIESRPHLQILKAYVEINKGNLREANNSFTQAQKHIQDHPGEKNDIGMIIQGRSASGLSAIYYHYYMDWQATLTHAQSTLQLLPKDYLFDRCVASFHGGGALIKLGNLSQARDYLNNAMNLSNLSSYPSAKFLILSYLGELSFTKGRLNQAQTLYQEVSDLAPVLEGFGTQSPASSSLVGLALLHYERNQLDKALTLLEKVVTITEGEEFIDRMMSSHSAMIKLQCTLENYEAVQEYLRLLSFTADNYGVSINIYRRIDFLKIETDLVTGDVDKAILGIQKYYTVVPEHVCCEKELELLIYVRCLIQQAFINKALVLLNKMLDLANTQDRITSVIRIEILLAKCHYLLKDSLKGVDHLLNALELAESEVFIRIFIDEGEPIHNLLSKLQKTNQKHSKISISLDYIQTLLSHFSPGRFSEKNSATSFLTPSGANDHLTPRETEVISLLAKGLQYTDVAEKLDISENTLKYHIKNIYGKLQVNNRIQAITAAQDFGIL